MAAAPPEVTHVRGVAWDPIGALSVSGSEGAGGVTSILREDILEEGTLLLADARVFGRHLKSWQVFFFPLFPRSLKNHVFELLGVCCPSRDPPLPKSKGDRFPVYFDTRYTGFRQFRN